MRFTTFAMVLAHLSTCIAHYTLKDDLSYKNFFHRFGLYSDHDPTNGFVAYQPLDSAVQNQYVGYLNTSVYLGVDYENITMSGGRPSIRVESKTSYNYGLLIADLAHMPSSTCGVWPAFWMLGDGEWPRNGEIDILEGVNDIDRNSVTLHTTAGCVVDNSSSGAMSIVEAGAKFSGTLITRDCDVQAKDQDRNQGCSIQAPLRSGAHIFPSYGSNFNKAGGGLYAMQWTQTSISVWFFPRGSPLLPAPPSPPSPIEDFHPDPGTWGTPLAHFSGSGCDFAARFRNLRIIFDTTFCGEWAGRQEVWDQSCAAKTGVRTCEEYVKDNPSVFADAFWKIDGLWWFEEEGEEGRRGPNPKVKGRVYRW